MSDFGAYARYYDRLYRDKDYPAEASFVHGMAQEFAPGASTLLDFGCGTGQHALLLATRGYLVTGVDRSEEMLEVAHDRLAAADKASAARLCFAAGDMRDVRLGGRFDVTAALFHVMSYQVTNEDLAAAFEGAHAHTNPGGVFIFDCWFGPGVLSDPPRMRVKRLSAEDGVEITRLTEPRFHPLENRVDIEFTLIAIDTRSGRCEQFHEMHNMRYLFKPEIEMLAQAHGFEIVECCQWLNRQKPDATCWNACFVARAR
ncbi:MAG: methyltransferase domain-containing protein [Alphaproteobacteria bacterium]|nr:methyltransferase domain-containing protein [Alphaproteobacteria bacterium]MDE2493953.1 methyltransferase domain-containing protein [Alphaproteobacteria bacterium]